MMAKVDKWRAAYNALRGLTVERAVSLLETAEAGQYADLMWTFRMLEKREATLRALKRLRLASLGKLDWDIKIAPVAQPKPGEVAANMAALALQRLAKAQADYLRSCYDRMKGLKKAIRHLALAEFRGYAHLEKVYENDNPRLGIVELDVVEQWHWVRDGLYGAWEYNAKATQISRGVPIDPRNFVIREVEDPINEIAFFCWLRKNLSQKDWDAFVETYGLPPVFVEMPDNIPEGKEDEYQDMAEAVTGDMRGVLPKGAKIQTVADGARGTNPFREHLNYQDEQLVLAGTSGKLTMLTAPAGLDGGSQGDAHQDTFDSLAIDEAGDISEIFQDQIDKALLAQRFPGQPVLAYFQLAAEDKADVGQLLDHAVKAKNAGLLVDAGEFSEKTGYKLTVAPAAPAFHGAGAPQTFNRDAGWTGWFRSFFSQDKAAASRDQLFNRKALLALGAAQRKALQPLIKRIVLLVDETDDAKFDAGFIQLKADLPAIGKQVLSADSTGELAKAWESILGPALVSGAAEAAQRQAGAATTRNRNVSALLGWFRSLFRHE
ncbi:MAG: DUF935 family protein [Opitutaceae bacterium]